MAGSKKKKAVRRGLNRKQFLLGLVVVCGAALIIECALLIHTFSKKKEKPKENPTPTPTVAVAEQTQPTETPKPTPGEPWGYTMKSYEAFVKKDQSKNALVLLRVLSFVREITALPGSSSARGVRAEELPSSP